MVQAQVGDYNETLALGSVIGKNKSDVLNIGSIKSNIGHLEASSGLASILKICLMMNKKNYYLIYTLKLLIVK